MVLIPLFRSFIFTDFVHEIMEQFYPECFNPFIQVFYFYTENVASCFFRLLDIVLIPLFRSFIFTLPFRFLYYIYNSNKCFAKVLLNLLIFL